MIYAKKELFLERKAAKQLQLPLLKQQQNRSVVFPSILHNVTMFSIDVQIDVNKYCRSTSAKPAGRRSKQ